MAPCMINATCCAHVTCDLDDITLLCKESGECLCLQGEACLAAGEESKGMGCVDKKEGDICRIALPCCQYACIKPKVCCAAGSSCLCCWSAASFPFSEDYVPGFVCALYGLQCAPNAGCCKPPPAAKAMGKPKGGTPDTATMER